MMTIDDIKRLIANDEHRTLELKKTTGELKDGMHAACAMLNTEGGWLIFGIAPGSLKILGQEVTDATQREIAQALAGLEPSVDVRVEYVDVPERPGCKVIAMQFDPFVWGREPFTYHGCPYYKIESTTKQMPRDMFEERLKAAKPQYYAWERQKAEGMSLDDIDESRVRGAILLGSENGRVATSAPTEPFLTLMNKLQLLTSDGLPNNAAAFLFGTKLNEFPQFKLRMARFRSTTKLEFNDIQQAEGNFFVLLDAGMNFFFKHLSLRAEIKSVTREEHLEIPVAALREALVNALCHRQWEKYNLTIGIAIYDDRIEIESPGSLPPPITPETIKQPHLSYPYNMIIADVLFKSTYLEKWGTGAQRIVELCREENVPEPTWKADGGFVTVTFRRGARVSECQSSDRVTNYAECPSAQVKCPSNQGSAQVECPSNQGSITNDRQFIILDYCIIPRSRREILEHVGITNHRKHFNRYIKPLLESGHLTMTQPNSPNSPTQKYVTIKK